MKIALIGYGKMGKAIEAIAISRGHEIILKVDVNSNRDVWTEELKNAEVAIEFTGPESAISNIKTCFDAKVPVVVGTTGWYKSFDEISKLCLDKNGGLFHATNFSLGVNIVFELNRKLAAIMNHLPEYQVSIKEIHHTQKLDAPSGTAISLAEQILENTNKLSSWELKTEGNVKKDKIVVEAVRSDEVPGTHYVNYHSEIDSITLVHEAHNRTGFALGAVLAAEFMAGKSGIFNMSYLINQIIKHGN